ncbi:Mu transposase C-terminal domain-containing protein [Achromobacter xylosoxidans]|uniref:Mu transposase C-terminal domain-containing protein n=1 Tax=Alcaligenes xylosoxydans xylosoxydans TaxID=85698 RepID=UPI00080A8270|nr:Mu transposase C-terminal domain-containing protein [Achromobacter xylosoxidans]
MAIFPLVRGFVVQIGERHFAFYRMLDPHTVQLEDVRTGAFRTLQLVDLQRQVASGKIRVVGHTESPHFHGGKEDHMEAVVAVQMLDETQRSTWQRRQDYVLAMRRRGVTRGNRRRVAEVLPLIAEVLQDRHPPSVSSVLRWLVSYESTGRNPAALISKNVMRPRKAQVDPVVSDAAWSVLKRFYFRRNGDSLVTTYRRMLAELKSAGSESPRTEKTPPSFSTFHRMALQVPAYERDRARLGPAAANAKWRHSTGGIYARRPMERVEMDHTELDLYVIDDDRGLPIGRPTVTILVDSFSGYVLAMYLSFEGESLGRLSQTLRLALEPKDHLTKPIPTANEWLTPGLWECLVVDNGLAFQSPQLKKIALALGCELEYCPVRKPWFKPTVERTIGDITGILPREGRPKKPTAIADRENPLNSACIMFSDLCAALTKWAVDVHPFSIPGRSLARPMDLMRDNLDALPAPVVCTGLDQLALITGMSKDITVRQGGVEFMYLPYRSPELGELVKRQRSPTFRTEMKYDPNDLGAIWVRDPSTRTWISVPCLYEDYARGLSLRQHRTIRAQAKETLQGKGSYEAFLRAEAELRDMFDGAIERGKRLIRDAKSRALLRGMTSLAPYGRSPIAAKPAVPVERLVTAEEIRVPLGEVPTFESFSMSHDVHWRSRP